MFPKCPSIMNGHLLKKNLSNILLMKLIKIHPTPETLSENPKLYPSMKSLIYYPFLDTLMLAKVSKLNLFIMLLEDRGLKLLLYATLKEDRITK